MAERVRICDIAEELGLSTATVSNVIHGKTNKVSDLTVQRVTALLEERQYIPNMAGILLAQNSSGIIGVFVNDHEKYEGRTLEDFFIASSLNCLSTEIERSGQFMMVKKARHVGQIIQFASMWNMDGIVVIGFCEQDYMQLRSHMRIPFAVYDGICQTPQRLLNITIDNYSGGYQVGQHFLKLGHTRMLCVSDNETGIDRARIDGFRYGRKRCGDCNHCFAMRQFSADAPHGLPASAVSKAGPRTGRRGAAGPWPIFVHPAAASGLRGALESG